jgi:C1A family cysteine protease
MARNEALDLGALRTALQQSDADWTMSATTMTALQEDEREIRLGVPLPEGIDPDSLEDDKESRAAAALGARADDVGAPASFDLRNVGGLNYVTPVRDQGGCGSCVAFGVTGALEGVIRYTRGTPSLPVILSPAHLFYCYGYDAGARCGTGWWPDQAYNACRDHGVTFENYYPYTAGDQHCSGLNADWPNRVAKVTAWDNLTNNPAAMKQYISTYGAISACFVVYQDFFSYRSGIYRHVSGGVAGGHCVTLIGYDDAAGCWIAKNQWGTGWGDGGFFKIAYGECNIESYQSCGAKGVNLRWWNPNQKVLAMWSNESDGNAWAYGSVRGWLKLDGGVPATNSAFLSDLASSKALGRDVGIFEDAGSVQQFYAW